MSDSKLEGACMSHRQRRRHNPTRALLWILAMGALAAATQPFPSGRYRVTTETGMPHLEENLRYSIDHVERCLTQEDLPTMFPVLEHPSLKSCQLGHETHRGERITYALICEGGRGTTGEAVWELGNRQI